MGYSDSSRTSCGSYSEKRTWVESSAKNQTRCFYYFFKDFIHLFLERQEGRGNEREKQINCERCISCLSCPNQGPAHNPGMCLDWELNQRPFALEDSVQPTEPQGSGPIQSAFKWKSVCNKILTVELTILYILYFTIHAFRCSLVKKWHWIRWFSLRFKKTTKQNVFICIF